MGFLMVSGNSTDHRHCCQLHKTKARWQCRSLTSIWPLVAAQSVNFNIVDWSIHYRHPSGLPWVTWAMDINTDTDNNRNTDSIMVLGGNKNSDIIMASGGIAGHS